ncbi:MAG: redoxin domain-containing protein [Armatimonadetes bacterium]|nr:redoxin domain-containing protein [Armatimonadota bacterium]
MKRPRLSANAWTLVILCLMLAGMVGEAAYNKMRTPKEEPVDPAMFGALPTQSPLPFPMGSVAPSFTLPDGKGKRHPLIGFRGKPTVLAFFCGCSACTEMAQYLNGMVHKARKAKKTVPEIVVIATFQPDFEASFAKRHKGRFRYLYDADKKVSHLYQGLPCPRVFLLGAKGRVLYVSPILGPGAEVEPVVQEVGQVLGVYKRSAHRAGSGSPNAAMQQPPFGSGTLPLPPGVTPRVIERAPGAY